MCQLKGCLTKPCVNMAFLVNRAITGTAKLKLLSAIHLDKKSVQSHHNANTIIGLK